MFGKKRPELEAPDHVLSTVRCISETFYHELIWARYFLSGWKVWSVGLFFAGFVAGVFVKDLDGVRLPELFFYAVWGSIMVAFPVWLCWIIFREKED